MEKATLSTNFSTTKISTYEIKNEKLATVNIITFTLFAINFIFGTIGNGLILFYFRVKYKPRGIIIENRIITEYLFSMLALVDFFAAALNPVLYMYWIVTDYKWYLGYWSCKILVPLGTVATTISGGIIAVLSFDRHRAIVYPFKRNFKLSHVKISLLFVLFYALIINIYYSINISLKDSKCMVVDPSNKAYSIPTIIYFLVNDCTLLSVICFSNYRIVLKTMDCKREDRKDNRRIIRLLIVITFVFFLLTLPRDVLHFVYLMSWIVGSGINSSKTLLDLNSFLKVINVSNSCVNPIIFYAMHAGFQGFIKSILCKTKSFVTNRRMALSEIESFARSQSV
ncbi:tachykinin-like peptides receptor 86C [Hydra vulgaris]|uniref:Tachykinin-like peptides receptor 86C n=1 Tax=Hydra vulgaris TaxID=6087 RepID=A0ABM4B5M1_HYDVU